jgi:hypothetical protein
MGLIFNIFANMKVIFNLYDDNIYLIDYLKDRGEDDPLESWSSTEGLISNGEEEYFGSGTEQFCGMRVLVNLT